MKLVDLLRALSSYELESPDLRRLGLDEHESDITQIAADSRQVTPGAIFVAYPGVSVDGARYISDAIARGAVSIVLERNVTTFERLNVLTIIVPDARIALAHLSAAFNDFPSRKLRVIGVTGTDGKTTTCTLIASILKAAGHKVGMITTVGAQVGDEEIDTGFHTTTPDAPEMQRYLARMVNAGMEYAVVEATSHGLAQHRLDAIDFDVAAVTNITHEHLDFHKTWEAYRDAKAMLFRSLAGAYRKARTAKAAVLNSDDVRAYEYLRSIVCDEQIVYAVAENGGKKDDGGRMKEEGRGGKDGQIAGLTSQVIQIFAHGISHSANGLTFTVATPHGTLSISSPLLGRYNVSNILAAIGVAIARRVPFDAIQRGIADVQGVVGRMQVMQAAPFMAIVDFAHTPNALEVALETAREIARGHVIVVFGCAGERDTAKREMMGEIAGRLADVTVVTAEDPRTEPLDAINLQIAQGLERAGRKRGVDYFMVNDRTEAIAFGVQLARAGDVVIATGKGHERSMCFGTTEYPWSDQEAVRAALSLGQRNR